MFDRKEGTEGSELQELCHFVVLLQEVCNVTDSADFVKAVFSVSFQYFAGISQTY